MYTGTIQRPSFRRLKCDTCGKFLSSYNAIACLVQAADEEVPLGLTEHICPDCLDHWLEDGE